MSLDGFPSRISMSSHLIKLVNWLAISFRDEFVFSRSVFHGLYEWERFSSILDGLFRFGLPSCPPIFTVLRKS